MKYSDGFYQDLRIIRPSIPKRSTEMVEALIEQYDLNETEITDDFLRGFEYAVEIIGEKLRGERRMSRLDDTISNVSYILDTLIAYRHITESGNCNNCGERKTCQYIPKLGEQVRYNCPFYKTNEAME